MLKSSPEPKGFQIFAENSFSYKFQLPKKLTRPDVTRTLSDPKPAKPYQDCDMRICRSSIRPVGQIHAP